MHAADPHSRALSRRGPGAPAIGAGSEPVPRHQGVDAACAAAQGVGASTVASPSLAVAADLIADAFLNFDISPM